MPRSGLALLALVPLALAGCEEPRHVAKKNANAVAHSETPPPAPKDNFIVGKTTQDIKKAGTDEVANGGQAIQPRITAKDPITLQGNAYVSMIGQASILNIQHAMDLYKAANDRYPKDLDEFMTEIIKANNIRLPQLPFYQEYRYDEPNHKLILIEYPDKKNGPPPQ